MPCGPIEPSFYSQLGWKRMEKLTMEDHDDGAAFIIISREDVEQLEGRVGSRGLKKINLTYI